MIIVKSRFTSQKGIRCKEKSEIVQLIAFDTAYTRIYKEDNRFSFSISVLNVTRYIKKIVVSNNIK